VEQNVRQSVTRLQEVWRSSEILKEKTIEVKQAVYMLETGMVKFLD
jgi:carbonic anhydrase